MMIPLLVLVAWVLLTVWPLFFRRWKYWKYLLPLSNFIVVALGAWLLCYFQMERNFTRGAEAEAVSTTREYLKNGGDPAILSRKPPSGTTGKRGTFRLPFPRRCMCFLMRRRPPLRAE